MDALYGYYVAEFARKQSLAARAQKRTAAGEWGSTAADIDPPAPDADISQIKDRLATLSREFRILIAVLLTDLAFQGDTEMRFLGIRLNYNEVYQLVRRTGGREKRAAERSVSAPTTERSTSAPTTS
jgi:gamma-tubulin complex component 3